MILTIKDPEIFDALVRGEKRYEGRRWDPSYNSLSEGDYLLFVLEGSREILLARVKRILRYPSIEDMVNDLWRELVPFAKDPSEAKKVYRQFYSLSDPAVAIEVEPLKLFVAGERQLRKWLGIEFRPLLIAIGVDGEELYDGHFGDSPEFLILRCSFDGCEPVERRKNTTDIEEEEDHEPHHGNPRKFRAVLSLLSDTDVWVAFRMGPNYVRIVRESDKVPFLAGTRNLQEAIQKVRRKLLELYLKRVCRWR